MKKNSYTVVKETKTDSIEGTVLGQRVSAPTTYTPEILVRVPRSNNRDHYNITNDDFSGYDSWYCYECSTLNSQGVPVYFGLVLEYSSESKYIVESKSLKLYLNSFNMERLPVINTHEVINHYIQKVSEDLTNLLETEIAIESFSHERNAFDMIRVGFTKKMDQYQDLSNLVDYSLLSLEDYNESPDLLKESKAFQNKAFDISFNGFRSNCLITHQPDYATVYISYAGKIGVDFESLVSYLTSFRNESHFHEECVELIYKRIKERFNPKLLWVRANYTRRGGLDINPTRTSRKETNRRLMDLSRSIYQ